MRTPSGAVWFCSVVLPPHPWALVSSTLPQHPTLQDPTSPSTLPPVKRRFPLLPVRRHSTPSSASSNRRQSWSRCSSSSPPEAIIAPCSLRHALFSDPAIVTRSCARSHGCRRSLALLVALVRDTVMESSATPYVPIAVSCAAIPCGSSHHRSAAVSDCGAIGVWMKKVKPPQRPQVFAKKVR